MAVKVFFGLPGCGKTTLLSKFALDAVRGKRYRNVYCNVRDLKVPGVILIDNDCIGKFCLEDGLILIDEATLFADSRDHRNFSKEMMTFFLEHRHFNVDIYLFTQQWDGIDRKIRVITDRVYYVYKGFFTGLWFTRYHRIPYDIIIPDPKKGNEKLGEIVQGYCKPNFFVTLFAPWVFRPALYRYFDSWSRPPGFSPLPSRYHPYRECFNGELVASDRQLRMLRFKDRWNKRFILLRSIPGRVSGFFKKCWRSLRSLFVRFERSPDK